MEEKFTKREKELSYFQFEQALNELIFHNDTAIVGQESNLADAVVVPQVYRNNDAPAIFLQALLQVPENSIFKLIVSENSKLHADYCHHLSNV